MLIFLFIVTIFGLANLYVFLKLTYMLQLGLPSDLFLGIFILFLALSPVLIHIYSFRGNKKVLTVFAYVGYMWLAFLIPFFPSAVILEIYNYAVKYGGILFDKDASSMLLTTANVFLIPIGLSAAMNIFGYFEAKKLRIERLVVKTSKLPAGFEKIRIAQISDLHLGIIAGNKLLCDMAGIIEREKPDLLVSTGDLVDGVVHHIDHLSGKLEQLNAKLGKFAVLGNHEIYGGLKHTMKFISDSGFTLLRGQGMTIGNMINIAGVDFTGGEVRNIDRNSPTKKEWEVLSEMPRDIFTLLLKHRSDTEEKSLGLFDLQLSGHTHKGQIFPMGLATMFIFKYHSGFTSLPKGSAIYVSRGTGTSGPPIRLLSKPEVTIIEIESANNGKEYG